MAGSEITKGGSGHVIRQADIIGAMRDEMERVLQRFERGWPRLPSALGRGFDQEMSPQFDVHDNAEQLTIEADLPGVDLRDVTVTLTGGMLIIKGEKRSERDETKENYYMAERSYGAFERSLRLPDTIDEKTLEAKFDKGVLRIVAQKKPDAVKAERKIEIKIG